MHASVLAGSVINFVVEICDCDPCVFAGLLCARICHQHVSHLEEQRHLCNYHVTPQPGNSLTADT